MQKTKCNFCKYYTGTSCMMTPNSRYCKEAAAEFFYSQEHRGVAPKMKSKRPWDK